MFPFAPNNYSERFLWAKGVPGAESNRRLLAQYGNTALPRWRANARVWNGNIRHCQPKNIQIQSPARKVILTVFGIHKRQF
jgi:hypothetical protein